MSVNSQGNTEQCHDEIYRRMATPAAKANIAPPTFNPLAALLAGAPVLVPEGAAEVLVEEPDLDGLTVEVEVLLWKPVVTGWVAVVAAVPEAIVVVNVETAAPDAEAEAVPDVAAPDAAAVEAAPEEEADGTFLTDERMSN